MRIQPNPRKGFSGTGKKAEPERRTREYSANISDTNTNNIYDGENLMDKVLERENMIKAAKRVISNKGCPGIDGISVEEITVVLKEHWEKIWKKLREWSYTPAPILRKYIPKDNWEKRALWIPTVLDRIIQQAISQVLMPIYEEEFSETSYGFRPGRKAEDAINKAKEYAEEGRMYVVDLDISKYFDNVNHDKLIWILQRRIKDKMILRIIRKYLKAWILEAGVKVRTEVWTPQWGPLSPLLSNIYLDELDKMLERRGHKFVRYADDCNIYVKSERAWERVLEKVEKFLNKKLKLKINKEKSGVWKITDRTFLWFWFYISKEGETRVIPSDKSKRKLKKRLKNITKKNAASGWEEIMKRIKIFVQGWIWYYYIADMSSFLDKMNAWVRRRLRMVIWNNWKRIRTRVKKLRRFGLTKLEAKKFACTRKWPWRIARSWIMHTTYTNSYLEKLWVPNFIKILERRRSI